ncbi:hypothetical protein CH253_19060 [Rhodococcus sp. 06-156-3C]|uniref:TetR/AcrR family transcriptional regulator n=1 Tax=Nocardiaceae TaxID=85025 RepID=UPI000BD51639|nr:MULTISPECIES: TetR family transcriptional regulator [Rhodococcus]OZD12569.1 hypothetical protein CH248_28580 [Rhodococcus sp. 06-156-4a]OZD18022.1 hypothetical protein CH253_19060 [Rhodococcus sp. 06-156-3C]OZD20418.1 hypothetical protein CH280_04535 [Rhodococcus sp. 06-156-4C]OZD29262.1 hypothetical protein CH284_27390 [Rhodococcus sp. 06-156-3]OZD30534.1 hypothetical protein CH247_14515 [Rhodococcus sp. 06-156-3b]
MGPLHSQRTLTARGVERRDALLDAAMSVVAGAGASSLTHRAVAAEASVSLASTTYHFASIEDLRSATFERALMVLDNQLSSAVDSFGGSIERMPRVFAEYVGALLTNHRHAVVTVNEMIVAASHDDHLRMSFHAHQHHFAELLAPCVGGQDAGVMVAAALQGLILSAVTYDHADTAVDESARWKNAVIDLIERVRR